MKPANDVHFTLNEAIERSRLERRTPFEVLSYCVMDFHREIGKALINFNGAIVELSGELTKFVGAYEKASEGDTRMDRIPETLRTRTFWTSIITAIVLVLTAMDVITLETEQLIATIAALVAVIFGNAWVDTKRIHERARLNERMLIITDGTGGGPKAREFYNTLT